MALRGLSCCARFLLHRECTVLRRAVASDCFRCRVGAKRHLLSEDVIRLQDFQQKKVALRVPERSKRHYFNALLQKMENNELILDNELKRLLHLCQTPEDMVIARKVMNRYHEANRNVEFRFGPLFMRLCYEMGLEDMAFAAITDRTLTGFFSDITSFSIVIDMLFTKGCYEDALKVVGEMKSQGLSFNKDIFTLAFATCYKLNTPKSYRICLNLLEEAQINNQVISNQAYCCAVALALKQNDTERAHGIYSQIIKPDSGVCRNMRVLMLVMAGSIRDAVTVLKMDLLSKRSKFVRKTEFSQEVLDVLRERSADGPWEKLAEQVVRRLQQAGQVTEQNMDDLLCYTPSGQKRPMSVVEDDRGRANRRIWIPLPPTLPSK